MSSTGRVCRAGNVPMNSANYTVSLLEMLDNSFVIR